MVIKSWRFICNALMMSGSLISASTLLVGCGGGGHDTAAPSPAQTITTTGHYKSLLFTLTTQNAYARGQKLSYVFTAQNTDTQPVQASINAAGTDASISQGSSVLWQSTKVGSFPGGSFNVTFAPGETKTFNGTWDQTDLQGAAVPSGQYSLKVWLLASDVNHALVSDAQTQLSASPVQITIY